jgi:hypothetical protein
MRRVHVRYIRSLLFFHVLFSFFARGGHGVDVCE